MHAPIPADDDAPAPPGSVAPPNHRFRRTACLVCGGRDLRTVLALPYGRLKQKASLDYRPIGVGPETMLGVDRCRDCGFVFANPRLRPEWAATAYGECKTAAPAPEPGARPRWRGPERALPLVEALAHLPPLGRPPVVIDYGCGLGATLSMARALGAEAYGVDIDPSRIAACAEAGLSAAAPGGFDAAFPGVRADVVVCQSNLEHLIDPDEVLGFVRDRMRPGGVLHVDGLTPRIIRDERRRGRYVKAHFIEHVNYFTLASADRLMARFGFAPARPRARAALARSAAGFLRTFVFDMAGRALPASAEGWILEAAGGTTFRRVYRLALVAPMSD